MIRLCRQRKLSLFTITVLNKTIVNTQLPRSSCMQMCTLPSKYNQMKLLSQYPSSVKSSDDFKQKCLKGPFSCQTHIQYCKFSVTKMCTNEPVSDISTPNPDEYMEACDHETYEMLSKDFLVYPNFISGEEEEIMCKEIETKLRRIRYETDHWDDAIHNYRETEIKDWSEQSQTILSRLRQLAFPPGCAKMSYTHILDLQKTGYIKPHIDSVRFCGSTIAGLSLMSSGVMKLVHDKNKDNWAKVKLGQRSLYIMRGVARYDYTHELLKEEESLFRNTTVPRDRRISVICRNEATDKDSS